MKKTIYTLAFVAFFSLLSNAQDNNSLKQHESSNQAVNPDGTQKPATSEKVTPKADDGKTVQKKEGEVKPAGGTRMAITEKGIPASKAKEEKATKKEQAKSESK